MALEAPDILELEQVCDFARSRLAQLEGDNITMDEDPPTEWELGCLSKTQEWLQKLKSADQMDRIALAVQALKEEGVRFWSDEDGPEIGSVLTISTVHITEETAHLLEYPSDNIPGLTVFPKGEYGWFIHAHYGDEGSKHMPDDLEPLLQWCVDNGIDWLCIDRDGEQHHELSTFDW